MANLNLKFRLFFPPFFANCLENPRKKRLFFYIPFVFSFLNVALIILKMTHFIIIKGQHIITFNFMGKIHILDNQSDFSYFSPKI